ncbi:MAG: hypothetical protein GY795_39930 [Desulfobacterales bacterium]|nr:hypothetical protein [Desulfobacterales bacterium]
MNITGYSERGIINSLFYEIRYSASAESLLEEIISIAQFPFIDKPQLQIKNAELFIEQSFSDFGDADALMLLSTQNGPKSVFMEAKVKSSADWTIDKEYTKFLEGAETGVNSSNLFTQLYHKVRLVDGLRQKDGINALQSGLSFPKCSSKKLRKIGQNRIVLSAVEQLEKYIDDTYYIAILPDSSENMKNFFSKKFSLHPPNGFNRWRVDTYGYISWADVEKFCSHNELNDTLRVFKFNEGQIYTNSTAQLAVNTDI